MIPGVIAAGFGGLVYLNALHNPFVYDDYRTIVDNGSIRTLLEPRAIVLHELTRPLVNLSYAIDHALWGPIPFGFHVASVVLHAANVFLLFLIAARMADGEGPRSDQTPVVGSQGPFPAAAFVAAALFAVHPMMTEAVGYISARPDVLSGTLFLGAFLCGTQWMRRSGGAAWWASSVGLWIAALLAKESAIMLPVVLLCYDRLILEDLETDRRQVVRRLHVPLFAIALLAGATRLAVFGYLERPAGVAIQWRALFDQALVMWRYVGLLFLQGGQTIFHEVRPIQRIGEPRALFGVGSLVALVVLAWRMRRVDAIACFGLLWFVVLLAPSTALAIVDQGPMMAEHRAYLASCGLFLTAGSIAARLAARFSRVSARLYVVGLAAFVVMLLSLGARTILRNMIWANPVALWEEAAIAAPRSWLPRAVLGETLHEAGRHEEAIAAYRATLALNPGDDIEYMNIAICLSETGRSQEAVSALNALARLRPRSPFVPIGLSTVAMLGGDLDGARRHLLEMLEREPHNIVALQLLASIEERANNPAEALRRCEEVNTLAPGSLSNEDCIRRNRARVVVR